MKKFLITFLICLCSFTFLNGQEYRIKYSADEKEPLTIENVIRLALENSYELLLIEQDLIIAEQRVKEARFLYFPQLSVNAAATGYDVDSPIILPENFGLRVLYPDDDHSKQDLFYGVGISALQYLYSGGRNSSTVDLAKATNKETQSRYEAAKADVIFRAKEVVYRYLYLCKKQALAEDILNRAKQAISKKELNMVDKIMAEAEISSFESELAQTSEQLRNATIDLLKVLNKELNSKIAVKGEFEYIPVEIELNKLNLWAMEFRPEVKSAIYKLEMDNIAVKLSLTRRYPDVLLGASYDRQGIDSLGDENMQVSLAVRLPLGYDYATQVRQKRAEQRQTALRQGSIEDAIRAQVLQAYNNLNFWQKETPKRIKSWDNINSQFEKFSKTRSSLKDTFQSLNYYYQAGVRCLKAKEEHLLAIASLEKAVGKDIRI